MDHQQRNATAAAEEKECVARYACTWVVLSVTNLEHEKRVETAFTVEGRGRDVTRTSPSGRCRILRVFSIMAVVPLHTHRYAHATSFVRRLLLS